MSSVPIQLGLVDGRAARSEERLRLSRGEQRQSGVGICFAAETAGCTDADTAEMALAQPHGSAFVALFTGVLVGTVSGIFYRELGSLLFSWVGF